MHKYFPIILDFFGGLFVGIGIGGAMFVFYAVYSFTHLVFLSVLAGILVGCIFVF